MRRAQQQQPRNSGTLLAFLALTAVAVGLLALLAVVLQGPALAMVMIVGGFFLFGAFHYLLWGWWLPANKPENDDELQ